MIYRIKPGIVLLRICDVDILAATRKLWEECPRVRPLPRLWAGCCSLMEKGRTSEEVISVFIRLFHIPEKEAREKLGKIFETLYNEGFLISSEEES